MEEHLYISSFNLKAFKGLIEREQFEEVIRLLKKWVEKSRSSYENEIINFSRRNREIKKLERSGYASVESISNLKSKFCLDLLSLLDDINEEEHPYDDFGLEGNI